MYKVEGFEFETKTQALAAKKEVEGIRYIREHTDMNDPDVVMDLYNRLILKEVFQTPVGYAFLGELQVYLRETPYIRSEDILPIPVYRPEKLTEEVDEREIERRRQKANKALRASNRDVLRKNKADQKERRMKDWQTYRASCPKRNYYKPFLVSTFFAIVFALALAGMFVITALSDNNINIINYENEVIDKYEIWEARLKEWEFELREREAALELPGDDNTEANGEE